MFRSGISLAAVVCWRATLHCFLVVVMDSRNLLILCYAYEVQWDIKFKPQKCQAATFGGNSPPVSVKLGDAALGWISNVKYLGCYFLSRSCSVKLIQLDVLVSSMSHLTTF